jgi:hypothetical protein
MNDPSHSGLLRFLVRQRIAVSAVSLVLALIVAVLTLLMTGRWYPEARIPIIIWGLGVLLGLLLFGLVNLFLDGDEEKQTSAERILVLWAGGAIGLATAIGGLAFAYHWWSDFLTWMTPGGERLNGGGVLMSLAALIGGVAIMFFSFRLVQGEERQRPVLRRVFYGYNAFLTGFLLLLNLLVFNTVVSAWTQKPEDFTANKVHTLSATSENLLKRLEQPVRVFVILNRGTAYGGLDLYSEMEQLLTNAEQHTDKLRFEHLDQTDANDIVRLSQMARLYPAVVDGSAEGGAREGVLILYGPKDPADYRFVAASDLVSSTGGRGEALFRGEEAVMVELSFLMDDQKKTTVYFTQGNGEPSLEGRGERLGALRRQLNTLKRRLEKRNYIVKPLTFSPADATVPTDASMVVVAGPRDTLPDYAVRALDDYWNKRQGKLVVLLDVLVDAAGRPRPSGLEELLVSNNIGLRQERILALSEQPYFSIVATSKQASSRLATGLAEARFASQMPRPVEVMAPRQPGARRSEALVVTLQQSILDSNVNSDPIGVLQNLARNRAELAKRVVPPPITVAALVGDAPPFNPHDPGGLHGSVDNKPRLAVFGSSSFIYDDLVREDSGFHNFDLFTGVLDWLREHKGSLSIGPKVHTTYTINPTASFWRLFLLPFGFILVGLVALALSTWLIRRR